MHLVPSFLRYPSASSQVGYTVKPAIQKLRLPRVFGNFTVEIRPQAQDLFGCGFDSFSIERVVSGAGILGPCHIVSEPKRLVKELISSTDAAVDRSVEQYHAQGHRNIVSMHCIPIALAVDIVNLGTGYLAYRLQRQSMTSPIPIVFGLYYPVVGRAAMIIGVIRESAFGLENELQAFLKIALHSFSFQLAPNGTVQTQKKRLPKLAARKRYLTSVRFKSSQFAPPPQ
jgi:hypothetical protein